mgnify:CR=1 FL=1
MIDKPFSEKELIKIEHIKGKLNGKSLSHLYKKYNKTQTKKISKTQSKYSISNSSSNSSSSSRDIDSKKTLEIYAIKDMIDKVEKEELDRNPELVFKRYMSYPLISDRMFQQKIFLKEEFNVNKVDKIDYNFEDKCQSEHFNLSNYQRFIKTFLSPNTPYNGLLLFHGTGVGKTCSAVQIAEQFKDFYDHKIRIILSQSIESGWKRNIYNPNKDSNQCTRNTYKHLLDRDIKESVFKKDIGRQVNKIIKTKYEFYGYLKFSNVVKQMKKFKAGNATGDEKIRLEKLAIRENFSNSLLIIDEAHNIRLEEGNSNKEIRNIIQIIDEVVRYSVNLKIILLTATPMFNRSNEIVWLLNILLKNDKRNTIRQNLFDKEGDITTEGTGILLEKSRGYISYVRGEDPITFPIRLYPDDINPKDINIYNNILKNYPTKTFKGGVIPTKNKFKFLVLKTCQFQNYQLDVYNTLVKTLKHDALSIMDDTRCSQISNIVYPDNKKNKIKTMTEIFGQKGFMNIFNRDSKTSYSYKPNVLVDYKYPILSYPHIVDFSSKIYTILNCIADLNKSMKSRPGVIFIYSRFLYSGILPLAMALEHIGFEKFKSGNLLNYPEYKKTAPPGSCKMEPKSYDSLPKSKIKSGSKFMRGKYIILSGDKDLSKNNANELKTAISPENTNGEQIKIILGTEVASEGIDLKYVREVHIIDPWRHLNKIEQIIGRGIRYCSHSGLHIRERNVTVYLHTGIGDNPSNESTDTYIYRQAEIKTRHIGKVEHILKRNAIDCYLFRNSNIIKPNDLPKIKSLVTYSLSKLRNRDTNDKSFSKICSYMEDCEYTCACDEFNPDLTTIVNRDTFSPEMIQSLLFEIISKIKNLYLYDYIYTEKELITLITQTNNYNDEYIKMAINNLCNTGINISKKILSNISIDKDDIYRESIILDKNNIEGYLIKIIDKVHIYYIFQPINYKHNDISMYERINNNLINNSKNETHIDLSDKSYITEKYNSGPTEIFTNYDEILVFLKSTFKIIDETHVKRNKSYPKFKSNRLTSIKIAYTDILKIYNYTSVNLIKGLENRHYKEHLENYVLDRLLYDERHIVFSEILKKLIGKVGLNDEEKKIFNNFNRLFITKNNEININNYDELIKDKNSTNIKSFYLFKKDGTKFVRNIYGYIGGKIMIMKTNLGKLNKNFDNYRQKNIRVPDYFGYIDISKNNTKDILFKYKLKGLKIHSKLPGKICGSIVAEKEYEILRFLDEEFLNEYLKTQAGSQKNKILLCFIIEMIMRLNNVLYIYEELSYIIK